MTGEELTCREFVRFVIDYLERELPEDDRLCFEAHLAICPDCVSYLDGYHKSIGVQRLAFDSEDPVPADVPQELVAAILDVRKRNER